MRRLCARRMLPGAVLSLALAPTVQAAVGAKVLVQVWSPLTPKQQSVQVLVNEPTFVTDQLQKAWTDTRPRLCAALLAKIGQGGAAGGQTLYDLKCLLDERPAFSVANSGAGALAVSFAIGGAVEATSTTPSALGSYADPRFSLALKTHLNLALSIQPDPAQTLRVDSAKFALSDATIDSHNLPADVLKFVADDLLPFFGGPKFRQLAESAIDGIEIDTKARFNAALLPVNAKLRGPSELVRVAVWGRPDAIIVAFGPRSLTPPSGGSMFGALRWDAGRAVAPGGCDSFSIAASVQTGPAPLRDPNGYFEPSDAPMRAVGTFQQQRATAPNECRYRIAGLANGWPNEIVARSSIGAGKVAGNSLMRVNFTLVGDGWDGHTVVPQPNAERNFAVRGSASGEASVDAAAAAKARIRSPADPVINNPSGAAANAMLKARVTPATAEQSRNAGAAAVLGAAPARSSLAATALKPGADAVTKSAPGALSPQLLTPSTLTPAQAPSALR